jgi:hypothetical protein
MVQVIKTERIVTNTVQGEVTINLNLTITVNHDGTVQVGTSAKQEKIDTIPDSIYTIPEFDSTEILNDFGASNR